jgi:hypothetical protein
MVQLSRARTVIVSMASDSVTQEAEIDSRNPRPDGRANPHGQPLFRSKGWEQRWVRLQFLRRVLL